MENQIEKLNPQDFGLEVEKVATIEQAFLPKIIERDAIAVIYEQLITSELTPELCKKAKEVRLQLVKVRTGIAQTHKTEKAFSLAYGRFVDAAKNKYTLPVEQMEEKLEEIENYFVNIEKARIAELDKNRKSEALQFTEYPASNLGSMSDDVYSAYITGLKVAHEAKIEAERKEAERLETERLAAIEAEKVRQAEIEAQRVENERLKKEAAELEALIEKERKEAAEKQAAIELKAKQEREAIERELKAKQEAELKAKQEAEAKALAEQKAAEKAAKAPIKNRLTAWVDEMQITAPQGLESNEKAIEIISKFNAYKSWAKSEIEKI